MLRLPLRFLFIVLTAIGMLPPMLHAQLPVLSSNPAAAATIYLDFDGQLVKGTSWNWDSTIHARPCGLPATAITEVFHRVAEDFRIFNINVTTDSTVYNKAPVARRIRVIVTPTSHWYGVAGGISFVNSFVWGDGTPAWVFTDVLQNNPKYIGEACSHEAGHTLGLQHQSTWDKNCNLVKEYAEGKGEGEISWAPIMGVSYYKNLTTWHVGTSIEGCTVVQNDISTIAYGPAKIGMRNDDHGNTLQTATTLSLANTSFAATGMITSASDVDVFKINLSSGGDLKTNISPANVGAGNAGANVDLAVRLVKSNGDTIGRYNPPNSLSVSIDTTLPAGSYFLVIDGVANQNITNYNSMGMYTVQGGFASNIILPVAKLTLKGTTERNRQLINWEYEADEPITSTTVECSDNGVNFREMAVLPPAVTSFSAQPMGRGALYYRVKMLAGEANVPYYSNVIFLEYAEAARMTLLSTIVQSSAVINVSGAYAYDVFDVSGKSYQRGALTDGYNRIDFTFANKGLLLLKVYNRTQQTMFKLIRQ